MACRSSGGPRRRRRASWRRTRHHRAAHGQGRGVEIGIRRCGASVSCRHDQEALTGSDRSCGRRSLRPGRCRFARCRDTPRPKTATFLLPPGFEDPEPLQRALVLHACRSRRSLGHPGVDTLNSWTRPTSDLSLTQVNSSSIAWRPGWRAISRRWRGSTPPPPRILDHRPRCLQPRSDSLNVASTYCGNLTKMSCNRPWTAFACRSRRIGISSSQSSNAAGQTTDHGCGVMPQV